MLAVRAPRATPIAEVVRMRLTADDLGLQASDGWLPDFTDEATVEHLRALVERLWGAPVRLLDAGSHTYSRWTIRHQETPNALRYFSAASDGYWDTGPRWIAMPAYYPNPVAPLVVALEAAR